MKKGQFTEGQIIDILKQVEAAKERRDLTHN